MSLTIFKGKLPAHRAANTAVAVTGESLDKKLGALRNAMGRADRFVSLCACAIHDKTFTVVYERTDPAQSFSIAGVYKDGEGDTAGSAGSSRSRTLPVAEVDHTGWRCPYCAIDRHVRCHQCHRAVCGGKTHRYPGTSEIFACRTSCGARGTLIDALTVEGVEPSRKPLSSKPIAQCLPVGGADFLRLGGAKPPRLK